MSQKRANYAILFGPTQIRSFDTFVAKISENDHCYWSHKIIDILYCMGYLRGNWEVISIDTEAIKRLPSPHACRRCDNYRNGRGDKLCLKCNNYKLLDQIYNIRSTITVIPMVQAVIEAIPLPAKPDNHLMQLIRELPASDAAMISMHYYGSLSVREIAQVMQITQEATSRRLYRAVSQLKKNITKQLPEVKTKIDAKMSHLLSPIDI